MQYSPSRLGGLKLCPKFKQVEDDSSTTPGTILHKAFETRNLKGLTADETLWMEAAFMLVDSYRASLPPPVQEFSELKVEVKDLDLRGTLDKLLLSSGKGIVIDLKTGHLGIPGEADDNVQLKSYVLAVFDMYPGVGEVLGVLTNPRTKDVSETTFMRDDVPAIKAELSEIIEKTVDPFSVPTPGAQCAKCQYAARCWALKPTIVDGAKSLWKLDSGPLDPSSTSLTPRERVLRHLLTKVLKNWADAVTEADKKWLADGHEPPPGLKMVTRSTGVRVRSDTVMEALARLRASGIDQAIVDAGCTLSVPKLAEALTYADGSDMATARERVYAILEGLLSEGSTSYLQKDSKFKEANLLSEEAYNQHVLGE